MSTAISLGLAPLGGGTLNSTLTESIWLGGRRFFVVYAQTAPNYLIAGIIDLSLDPYAVGTPTQTITTNQVIGTASPQDRPMLVRLDYNRVLMFLSSTNKTDSYNSSPTTKAFDAWVLEIDSNNNINVMTQIANAVPAAFMNYTQSYYQPTATKAVQGSAGISEGYCYQGGGNSTYLPVSQDGAAVNRALVATRQLTFGAFNGPSNATLWDIQYTVATTTLAITSRFTSATTAFGFASNNYPWYGPNDFPWLSLVPGTNLVLFGYVNYDPSAGNLGATTDYYRTGTNQTAFASGNNAYLLDITQAPAAWTAATTISTVRRASAMVALDSNRLLEITSQVCTTGTVNYCRIYTISSSTWSADIVTDASTATVNKNGSIAFGLPGQMTPLGNDHLLLTFTARAASNASGLAGTAYWGIYRLIGTTVLQAVPSLGVPLLAPLTFQRGADAFIQRSAGQDPQATSPNLAYDFYGRTSPVSYQFMRFANPPF